MKQRSIALLLAMTLVLALCAPALAGEADLADAEARAAAETGETPETDAADNAKTAGSAEGPASPAGPDPAPAADPDTGELLEEATIVPDALGTVTYANMERRLRENNLTVLTLETNIASIDVVDYDKLYENLRTQLNSLARVQSMMTQASSLPPESEFYTPFDSYAYAQLDQGYAAIREQFESIKDGEMQENNEAVKHQLRNLQDQVILGGEMLYVSLAGLEVQEAALQRQLASMNRTAEEMELRYSLGQISQLQLTQTKAGRSSLVSGLETLRMNIRNMKTQLEMMLGAELTGEIKLGEVPAVTEEQLAKMDLDADLDAAKEKSYELYEAEEALKDAKDEYIKGLSQYGYESTHYGRKIVDNTWQGAQYTYNDAIQNYELRFRTLYAQILDYQQILEAARISLESQRASYAASELRYRQGTISENALLAAKDELTAAEERVRTSANDLFSSYNTYCWAVEHGILN